MNIFPRPRHQRTTPPPPQRQLPPSFKPGETDRPRPVVGGTMAAILGIALTGLVMQGRLPSDMARFAAIGVAVSLVASLLADLRVGVRNLIRADVMAILAFYFLTLFEFLFPQPEFNAMIDVRTTHEAIIVVLIGFGGLLVGRHCVRAKRQPFEETLTREIPRMWMIVIFWICFFVGYMHMLIAVDFNVADMVFWFMEPRFSQPWQRGKFGDWKALLVELGLFIFLIPPMAGIMIARRQRYPKVQLFLVAAALLFTAFYGFTTGTRNLFCSYLVTFLIGYAFALPFGRQKELVALCSGSAVLMFFATYFMLQFRTVGFSNYVHDRYEPPPKAERTLFVDYNLYAICKLVEVFPRKKDYLGFEIPYQALIRPIPRAIWKGKPEGLSTSIEDALGVEGLTISASFVGEAYMSGGMIAVLMSAFIFGAITGWWSFLASSHNSELGILIYASGFFASVISMRSLFVFTTALLPTVAAIVIGSLAVKYLANQARKLISRPSAYRPPPPQRGPRK
jgi:hypothetical protein